MLRKLPIVLLAGLLMTPLLWAQTRLNIYDAELSVAFDVIKGKLVLLEDRILFIDEDHSNSSLLIPRSQLGDLEIDQQRLTLVLDQPIATERGNRSEFVFRLRRDASMDEFRNWKAASTTPLQRSSSLAQLSDEPVENSAATYAAFEVKHDHFLGDCRGQLIVDGNSISYESTNKIEHSRNWKLGDIEELESDNPYELKVESFQGDDYSFELTGKGISSATFSQMQELVTSARVEARK